MNKIIINSHRAPEPIGPYSQAVRVNDTLYVSGQIALDRETGELVSNDIASETHQVMRNLEHILHEAGMALKRGQMHHFPQKHGRFWGGQWRIWSIFSAPLPRPRNGGGEPPAQKRERRDFLHRRSPGQPLVAN
jgi:hypothetical protein